MQPVAVAEPDLRERTGIRHVVHLHMQPRGSLNARLDARHRPVQIRREDKLFQNRIGATRKADANAVEGFFTVRSHQLANRIDNRLNRLIRIIRQRNDILRNNLAAKIRHRNRRLRRMNIQRDHRPLVIQFKKRRPASARRPSRRPFKYPSLLDQVFDDQRNSAALQAGDAGKISAR